MKLVSMFGASADEILEKRRGLYADDGHEQGGAGGGNEDAGDDGDDSAAGGDDSAGVDDKKSATGGKKLATSNSLVAGEGAEVVDKGAKRELNLLAGKFKTPAELEEGYKALSKKLTESGKLAPEKYEPKLPDGMTLDSPDSDPQLKGFYDVAKKHNLSNEAVSDIIAMKLGFDAEAIPDYDEEVEKLGVKGPELMKGLSQFLMARLDAEEFEAVSRFAVTAQNIKILDKLRQSGSGVKVPGSTGGQQPGRATPEEAEEALAKARKAEKESSPDAGRLRREAESKFQEAYPE